MAVTASLSERANRIAAVRAFNRFYTSGSRQVIRLTGSGRSAFAELDARSATQIEAAWVAELGGRPAVCVFWIRRDDRVAHPQPSRR